MEDADTVEQLNEDRRIVLTIQGRTFNPSKNVTSTITDIWKSRFTGAWDTWTKIPQVERDILFDDFKDKYTWDTKINVGVKRLFNSLGAKSFRDCMSRIRKKPLTEKPKFMNLDAWQALRTTWASPEFLAKSDKGKAARQANKHLHVGGSIPNAEHRRRLQEELGREPTAAELFARTHKRRKDNKFVDTEAEEIWEQYNELYGSEDDLDTQSGNVSNTYSRWANHVGITKGNVYGLASAVEEYDIQPVNGSSSRSSSSSFNQNAQSDQELARIREMMERQQLEQEQLTVEQDRIKATQEAQAQKLDQIVKSQALMEENIRVIQQASQKVLDLLQHRPFIN